MALVMSAFLPVATHTHRLPRVSSLTRVSARTHRPRRGSSSSGSEPRDRGSPPPRRRETPGKDELGRDLREGLSRKRDRSPPPRRSRLSRSRSRSRSPAGSRRRSPPRRRSRSPLAGRSPPRRRSRSPRRNRSPPRWRSPPPDERARPPPGRGICYAWQKGECARGENCRFAHEGEAGSGGGGGGRGEMGGPDADWLEKRRKMREEMASKKNSGIYASSDDDDYTAKVHSVDCDACALPKYLLQAA